MLRLIRRHVLALSLLLAAFLTGLTIYRDYGVCWDDPTQREIGLVSYNYVIHGDPALKTYRDRTYGVAFELALLGLEKGLRLEDSRDIYRMRHLATHSFFLLGAFAGYCLFYRLFRSRALAVLGLALLLLHPRIYAHSFFNSKDIPFLTVFLIALALAHRAFRKNTGGGYFLLGLATGLTTGIRILGVLLVVLIAVLLLAELLAGSRERRPGAVAAGSRNLLAFLAGTAGMLYACWPFLWEAPLQNLVLAYQNFAHFSWNADVLFNGVVYTGTTLPWYYLPVWAGISTPPVWLLAGGVGVVLLLAGVVRRPAARWRSPADKTLLLALCTTIAPFAAVIVLHSVVYDDWRHVYFTYPPFVLLAVYGIHRLWTVRRARPWIAVAVTAQSGFVFWFLISAHPVQQAYFNAFVSHRPDVLRKTYELDYWGCSHLQGLEAVLKRERGDSIRVFGSESPLKNNLLMLPPAQRKRIKLVERGQVPYYFITNYRWYPPNERFDYPMVYHIDVLNSTVLGVYLVTK